MLAIFLVRCTLCRTRRGTRDSRLRRPLLGAVFGIRRNGYSLRILSGNLGGGGPLAFRRCNLRCLGVTRRCSVGSRDGGGLRRSCQYARGLAESFEETPARALSILLERRGRGRVRRSMSCNSHALVIARGAPGMGSGSSEKATQYALKTKKLSSQAPKPENRSVNAVGNVCRVRIGKDCRVRSSAKCRSYGTEVRSSFLGA